SCGHSFKLLFISENPRGMPDTPLGHRQIHAILLVKKSVDFFAGLAPGACHAHPWGTGLREEGIINNIYDCVWLITSASRPGRSRTAPSPGLPRWCPC